MSTNNPYGAAYLESKVMSASPLELICLAYEGTIEAICEARVHLKEKRISERSRAISKAQCIILELQSSLDFAQGGSLSVELARLYDYMLGCLRDANFRQVEEPLNEAQTLLETLLEGWKEIRVNEVPAPSMAMSLSAMNASIVGSSAMSASALSSSALTSSALSSSAWMSASQYESRFDLVL